MMASTVVRAGKRTFLSSSRRGLFNSRWVSSTTGKRANPNVVSEVETHQPSPGQQALNIQFYDSAETVRREEVNRNARADGFLHIKPDPLWAILKHPSASIILRDACKCSKCKDMSTSQREFNLAHIPVDLRPSSVNQDTQGDWIIKWQNDMPGWEDHTSVFTPQQVERLQKYMQNEHHISTRLWNKDEFTEEKFSITYDKYMHSELGVAEALFYLARHGLVFIKDVPENEHSIERLAKRISELKSTFYGPVWDIRSVPNAKNVAFTSKYLGFHADLVYMKEPPTAQFLHCIHNSADGGESRFVDQFKAIDTLFTEDPELGSALARTRLRYEYENDGSYYTDIKPIVQWRTDSYQFPQRKIRGAANPQINQIYRMFWAPQFLGSIISDLGILKDTLETSVLAMKKYADILEREELVYEEKMEPGTCVMFDNLRVLHARNEFDQNSGKRWLRGTYVDGQDLWSREMKLRGHLSRLEQQQMKLHRLRSSKLAN